MATANRPGCREFSSRQEPVKRVAAGASAKRPEGRGGTDCPRAWRSASNAIADPCNHQSLQWETGHLYG